MLKLYVFLLCITEQVCGDYLIILYSSQSNSLQQYFLSRCFASLWDQMQGEWLLLGLLLLTVDLPYTRHSWNLPLNFSKLITSLFLDFTSLFGGAGNTLNAFTLLDEARGKFLNMNITAQNPILLYHPRARTCGSVFFSISYFSSLCPPVLEFFWNKGITTVF